MRIDEFFDAADFDPADFDVAPVGGSPPLWLIIKPKKPVLRFRPRKRKRKGKRVSKDTFLHGGFPLPSPQFLQLLDVLDALGYLDVLIRAG